MAVKAVQMSDLVDAYLAMRRVAGYALLREGADLRKFAKFCAEKGVRHVATKLAIQWAERTPSRWLRVNRLRTISHFAEYARAEDGRHEVPPLRCLGTYRYRRPTPYILSRAQIDALLREAGNMGPKGTLRPQILQTLFALIAVTGLRISEALGLTLSDVGPTGLVVRKSKFGKGRVLPIHSSTWAALESYISRRRQVPSEDDHLFISLTGKVLRRHTVEEIFRELVDAAGIPRKPRIRGPVIHSLRHTFAVRALEASTGSSSAVAEHMLAVSRYLGHSDVVHTYWYYESTPQLMRAIARLSERAGGR